MIRTFFLGGSNILKMVLKMVLTVKEKSSDENNFDENG
jgi:hypothetical protein